MERQGFQPVPRTDVGRSRRKQVVVGAVGKEFPNSWNVSRSCSSGGVVGWENKRVIGCFDRVPQPFLLVLV
jgi:hypothetical protein